MGEKRLLIISRKFQKADIMQDLFVAKISGGDVSGSVFQFEIWLNNVEQPEKRVTSGNSYAVRRTFLNTLLDLLEDGWSKRGAASYGSSHGKFFDPGDL
jgi:hypothetical protein